MTIVMSSGIMCQSPHLHTTKCVSLCCVRVNVGTKQHGKGSASCISKEDTLHTHQDSRKFLQQYNVVSFVVKIGIVAMMALLFLGTTLSVHVAGAHAQSFNRASVEQPAPVAGTSVLHSESRGNVFPYPACTWWANERYAELHGYYVPWTTNAMAWQWKDRAHDFKWHISTQPEVGSIIDLQPWVQGAYGGGHVAVVEKILHNGHVIASNMSWGANPYTIVDWEFAPGPGVTFLSR